MFEAKVKEGQKEEEKKKKIEQKMAQIDEKNDKVREHVRLLFPYVHLEPVLSHHYCSPPRAASGR